MRGKIQPQVGISRDHSDSFTRVDLPAPMVWSYKIEEIIVDGRGDIWVAATGPPSGLFVSRDGGRQFTVMAEEGVSFAYVEDVFWGGATDRIYAVANPPVYSDGHGASWKKLPGL